MRKSVVAAALAATLAAACSGAPGHDGPEHVVLQVGGGIQNQGPASTRAILDLGLPTLTNITDSTIRLRFVQLVHTPLAVQVLSISAYERAGTILEGIGNLPKLCPGQFNPLPVTKVVLPPRSAGGWNVIIALRFRKPGTFHISKVKIAYFADGKPGWQYQYLNDTAYARTALPPAAAFKEC
jgi:hypothetical protein